MSLQARRINRKSLRSRAGTRRTRQPGPGPNRRPTRPRPVKRQVAQVHVYEWTGVTIAKPATYVISVRRVRTALAPSPYGWENTPPGDGRWAWMCSCGSRIMASVGDARCLHLVMLFQGTGREGPLPESAEPNEHFCELTPFAEKTLLIRGHWALRALTRRN